LEHATQGPAHSHRKYRHRPQRRRQRALGPPRQTREPTCLPPARRQEGKTQIVSQHDSGR
jgi:hypothetical protein